MKWKKYTITTTTEAEDLISLMLNELGVEGVQIEDNIPLTEEDTKGMFIDILPELPPDDGTSRLSFFLREANEDGAKMQNVNKDDPSVDASYTAGDRLWTVEEINKLLEDVRTELEAMRAYIDIGEGSIEASETEDIDWMNNWKQFFKPFTVEDFLIKPSWEEIPDEYKEDVETKKIKLIEIDPGTAFGTGSHETTQLCIKMIKKYVSPDDKVLDIGTGSGILGIAALKSGAKSVVATDLDDVCMEAVKENTELNGISEDDFKLIIGNILGDEEVIKEVGDAAYDIVVANILAPVIIMLAACGAADRHIKQGGIFITSGIINTKEEEVLAAFSANKNWEVIEVNHQGEWVNVTARRR
ncbi:MAG: 50S ribosomal protein L11 methyltransferase [Eubacteriales bacterium]|nr:50S ribosomal protein L11 methyltransferase [Eubacteriales bacterium]